MTSTSQGSGTLRQAEPRLGVNKIDLCPRHRCWWRAAAPLCPCQRPLGNGSSVGPPSLIPWADNQVTTLGQAGKGRGSISVPGMQLDPATTQERQGGRARSSAEARDLLQELKEELHGWLLWWKGTHGTQVNAPCLTTPALWGRPCASTRSFHRAPCSECPWSPSARTSRCPPARYLHRLPGQIGAQVLRPDDLGGHDVLVLQAERTSPSAWGWSRPTAVCSQRGLAEEVALQGHHQAGGHGRWDLLVPSGRSPEPGLPPAQPRAGGGAAPGSDRAFPRMTA